MAKGKLVTAIFNNRQTAEQAVNAIFNAGYRRDDISVLMSDAARAKHFALETGTKAAEGAGVGAAAGGTIGAVVAGIAAIGTNLILPGVGLIVAGPLAAGLAGLGAGGAAGGLIGALVGAGIPEHRAKAYESSLKAGGILLGVAAKSDEDANAIEKLFESIGAQDVKQESLKKDDTKKRAG